MKGAIKPYQSRAYLAENLYENIRGGNHGKYIELLTTNTIIRWRGNLKSDQTTNLIIEDALIKDVAKYAEEDEVCEFISKDSKLDILIDKHESIIKAGNKIDAFLITENGKKEEVLQGIITSWEIPEIYNKLNI